jgi:hypothetical protein
MNHAMKDNSQKNSSTSCGVKSPLDSNKENISAKFQPPARSAAPLLAPRAAAPILVLLHILSIAIP